MIRRRYRPHQLLDLSVECEAHVSRLMHPTGTLESHQLLDLSVECEPLTID